MNRETIAPIKRAENIQPCLWIHPNNQEGIPHKENLSWLQQYTHGKHGPNSPLHPRKGYLITGSETYPLEIWESLETDPTKNALYTALYQRIWKNPNEQRWEVTLLINGEEKTHKVTAKTAEDAIHDALVEETQQEKPEILQVIPL